MMMKRRTRMVAAAVLTGCALAAIAAFVAIYALQTAWFRQHVRERILAAAESTTGGRVELGSFNYNWRTLTAEFTDFVIRGSEPAGAPPLLRTGSLRVGLRVVSLLKRDIEIASITLDRPQIHLLVHADGTTNVPQPKLATNASRFVDQLLGLKVRSFECKAGYLEVNTERFPFTMKGGGLNVLLKYSARRSEYSIAFDAHDVQGRDMSGSVTAALRLARDHLAIDDLRLLSNSSTLTAHGALEHFENPAANVKVEAHFAAEAARLIGVSDLRGGEVGVIGALKYDHASGFDFDGNLDGHNLFYNSSPLTFKNVTLTSHVRARAGEVTFSNLSMNPFGSRVTGIAVLTHGSDLQFAGQFHGFSVRNAEVLRPHVPIPWGGMSDGALRISGTLGRRDFTVQMAAHIAPASNGIPLSGEVNLLYKQSSGALTFDHSHIDLPHTRIGFSGTAEQSLQLNLSSTDLGDIDPTGAAAQLPTLASGGKLQFDGIASGPLTRPYITGDLTAAGLNFERILWTQLHSRVMIAEGGVDFTSLSADSALLHITGGGHLGLDRWLLRTDSPMRLDAQFDHADVARLSSTFLPASIRIARGAASGSLNLFGSIADPRGTAILRVDNLETYGAPAGSLRLETSLEPGDVRITRGVMRSGGAVLIFSGDYQHPAALWQGGEINLKADSNGFPLTTLAPVRNFNTGLQALVEVHLRASAHATPHDIVPTHADGTLVLRNLTVDRVPYGSFTAGLSTYGQTLDADFSGSLRDTRLSGRAHIQLASGLPATGDLRIDRISLPTLYALLSARPAESLPFDGFLQGAANFAGPLQDPDRMRGTIKLDRLQVSSSIPESREARPAAADVIFHNTAPVVFDAARGLATIRSLELSGKETALTVRGSIPYLAQRAMNFDLNGSADLRLLQILDPDLRSSGQSLVAATIHGTLADPAVNGTLQVKNGSFLFKDVPNGLTGVNGTLTFDRNRATIQNLTGKSGGGDVALSGFLTYGAGGPLVYRLESTARDVRVRYAGSASIRANANLRLTGTSASSILSGTLTISRASFTPNTDVGNLLAAAAAPSASPEKPADFLTGLQLDLHIENAPDLELTTELSRDVQASIDLRLRGTPAHPVLLGSVEANQGDIKVFGAKYSINRGEVSFNNPVKIEPVVNLDLQTRARGIVVDITISGTPGKLNINYRSDPPLQPRDIIALLTVGHTPDVGANISNTQNSADLTALQSSANTVLGAAMSPSTSRLQRLFGVANIKIDPMVQGITNTMQRLTIEQQISRNITVTYVTNLSQTSEQIFRLEWALSPQYSLVALRDDNGEFGIDIQYKKRFK